MSIFELKNVTYFYSQAKVPTLDNISLKIEKGEYCAIVGSNGSGKSTLARLLAGLNEPTSGELLAQRDSLIALVFQHPKNQIICSIVSRDTAFGPKNLDLPKSEIELRTIECLNVVELLDKFESSTMNLSLGQTQKLALGGVLATWPGVIILDESVSMLDPGSRKNVFEFISYWHRHGNTVIHITHELDAIKRVQHVIGIEKGKLFFDGSAQDYLNNAEYVHKLTGDSLPECNRQEANIQMAEKDIVFGYSNVSFAYENEEKNCLYNVSFSLRKGSLNALTGPSGSGKSTILELGSGLIKAASGEVYGLSHPSLALQNCSDAVFESFAADDVAFGLRNMGIKGEELKLRVRLAMDSVNLPFEKYAEVPVNKLSGGELRRLAIAGIIAMDKDVLFFDEPTAGLDGESRQEVMNLLKKLAEEGKTVLFSTHNMEEAGFAHREIKIMNGTVVSDSFEAVSKETPAPDSKTSVKQEFALEPKTTAERISSLRSLSNSLAGTKRKNLSPLEKIPAFLRILIFIATFTLSLVFSTPLPCGIMLLVSFAYCLLAGFSIKKLLTAFLKITPFLLFFAVFQLIFRAPLPGEAHFTQWKWFLISPSKLWFCLCSFLRTFACLGCISAFYTSLRDYELIDGLRVIFYPLEKIKVPMRYLYLVLEIIFRFIPLLVDQSCVILKTQSIRGSMGSVKGKLASIKAVVPLIVPIIIQTVKRSEALADAITVRCFK